MSFEFLVLSFKLNGYSGFHSHEVRLEDPPCPLYLDACGFPQGRGVKVETSTLRNWGDPEPIKFVPH